MKGQSFFRTSEGKCPQCGNFGENFEDEDIGEGMVCPTCDTVFNKYMVLDQGQDYKFRNN